MAVSVGLVVVADADEDDDILFGGGFVTDSLLGFRFPHETFTTFENIGIRCTIRLGERGYIKIVGKVVLDSTIASNN